jgi:hypothetical protein
MKEKEQFLLSYHRIAWENINAHRDGLWKILIPYLGFYVAVKDIYEMVGAQYVFIAFLALNAFVIAISINFNLWFLRNMAIIQNIESYFLDENDYGRLLPKSYKVPESYKDRFPFHMPEIWIFVVICASFVHVFIFGISLYVLNEWSEQISLELSFGLTVSFLIAWYSYHQKRYSNFVKETKGYHNL